MLGSNLAGVEVFVVSWRWAIVAPSAEFFFWCWCLHCEILDRQVRIGVLESLSVIGDGLFSLKIVVIVVLEVVELFLIRVFV